MGGSRDSGQVQTLWEAVGSVWVMGANTAGFDGSVRVKEVGPLQFQFEGSELNLYNPNYCIGLL